MLTEYAFADIIYIFLLFITIYCIVARCIIVCQGILCAVCLKKTNVEQQLYYIANTVRFWTDSSPRREEKDKKKRLPFSRYPAERKPLAYSDIGT